MDNINNSTKNTIASTFIDRKEIFRFNRSGDFNTSKLLLQNIIEEEPHHHLAMFLLGETFMDQFKEQTPNNNKVQFLNDAKHWYEQALVYAPNNFRYRFNYAFSLYNLGALSKVHLEKLYYYDLANAELNKIESYVGLSSDYRMLCNLATIFEKLKQDDKALEYYRAAIDINFNKNNYSLFRSYGTLLLTVCSKNRLTETDAEEIKKCFLKALEIKPSCYTLHFSLGKFYNLYVRNGLAKSAKENRLLKLKAIECFSTSYELSNQRCLAPLVEKSTLLIAIQAYKEAIDLLKFLIRKMPQSINLYKSIAVAYMRVNDKTRALFYLSKSLALTINHGKAKDLETIIFRFKYGKLFKEVSASFVDKKILVSYLEKIKTKYHMQLMHQFLDSQIAYQKLRLIKQSIESIKVADRKFYSDIEDTLANIEVSSADAELQSFKIKITAKFLEKKGDLATRRSRRTKYYEKSLNELNNSFKDRKGEKPHSYYKMKLVLMSKLALLKSNKNAYEEIAKLFEKQIRVSDNSYGEINFEYAKFLEKLIAKKINLFESINSAIDQFTLAKRKFLFQKHTHIEEIHYVESRLIYLNNLLLDKNVA